MFNDITTVTTETGAGEKTNTNASGTKSSSCGLMCEAAVGYDGPTGWGSPNGAAWPSSATSGIKLGWLQLQLQLQLGWLQLRVELGCVQLGWRELQRFRLGWRR